MGTCRLRLTACLILGLATLVTLPGCGGCQQDPLKAQKEAEKKAAEERAKKEEKPKPDFDPPRLSTRPSDRRPDAEPDPLGPPCKPGHWTGVTLAAKTNNFDFVGDLEIVATDIKGDALPVNNTAFDVATIRQISLPKREPKVFESVMFVPPSDRQALVSYRFNWRKGGRNALQSSRRLALMPSYQYHFVVLARWPGRYVHLTKLASIVPPSGGLTSNPTRPYYRVSLMPGDRRPSLPSYGLLWTSIAYVLWDDADPGYLTLDQQQSLLDWLHWGGQLIVSGPNSLDTLRDSFLSPYLPATSLGSRELIEADFKELSSWANGNNKKVPPLVPVRPLTGVKFKKHPQAEFILGSGQLMVERRVGRGRIVVSAFSLSSRDLTNWDGLDEMFNAFLLRRKRRTFSETNELDLQVNWADSNDRRHDAARITKLRYFSRDTGVESRGREVQIGNLDLGVGPATGPGLAAWNDSGPVAQQARTALKTAAQIEIPTRGLIFSLLAGYLVVLVPANWILFRLVGRIEWAWAAAPLIAVVCTAVVINAAQVDIGFARKRTEITVLELQPGYPRAHATRYTALYTSLTTEYDLHSEDPGTLMLAFPKAADARALPDRRGLVYRRNGKNVILENYFVRSNSIGMLHSEQMVDLGGALSLVETPGGGLRLINRTELTLHEAEVIKKSESGQIEIAWLGLLEPEAQRQLRFTRSAATSDGNRLWQNQRTDPMLTGNGLTDGELDLSQLVLLAEGRAKRTGGGSIAPLKPGEIRLVAGLKNELSGPAIAPVIDPAAPQVQLGTVVIAHLRYGTAKPPGPDTNTLEEFKRNQPEIIDPYEISN